MKDLVSIAYNTAVQTEHGWIITTELDSENRQRFRVKLHRTSVIRTWDTSRKAWETYIIPCITKLRLFGATVVIDEDAEP